MRNNIIFMLILTLLVAQSSCTLLNLAKGILPIPIFGCKQPIPSVCPPVSNHGPLVHSKQGCDIEVLKPPQTGGFNGFFGGFSDSFKAELAGMISEISLVNTPQAKALKIRITNSLLAINRILNLINQYPHKEKDYKPLLQKQVKQFLLDLDDIQDLMTKQTNVTVVGNGNAAYASTGTIKGNNSVLVGSQSTILGNSNTLVGNKTIVAGNNNNVKGNNNVAVGKGNKVDANNAIVFTNGDTVDQSNTLTVGHNTIDLEKLNGKGNYLVRD